MYHGSKRTEWSLDVFSSQTDYTPYFFHKLCIIDKTMASLWWIKLDNFVDGGFGNLRGKVSVATTQETLHLMSPKYMELPIREELFLHKEKPLSSEIQYSDRQVGGKIHHGDHDYIYYFHNAFFSKYFWNIRYQVYWLNIFEWWQRICNSACSLGSDLRIKEWYCSF